MDSSLHEVWQAAAGSPFFPTVNKDTQFTLAFALLFVGFFLAGVFALSMRHRLSLYFLLLTILDRTFINVPLLGVPASLAIAYVSSRPSIVASKY